jgi:hypothetical protein
MILEPGLGIEARRADIEAGGVVPGVRILPAEADLPPDRRMQFDTVDPMVQLRRSAEKAAATAHAGVPTRAVRTGAG